MEAQSPYYFNGFCFNTALVGVKLALAMCTRQDQLFSLDEVLPDPGAAQAFESVEERERQAHLHDALDRALSALPPDLMSVIVNRYYYGKIVDESAHNKTMHMLRHPKCSFPLREYVQ